MNISKKTATSSPSRLPCGGTPYEDVARVLQPYNMTETQEAIARDLATLFSYTNPDFDKAKFLTDCGVIL